MVTVSLNRCSMAPSQKKSKTGVPGQPLDRTVCLGGSAASVSNGPKSLPKSEYMKARRVDDIVNYLCEFHHSHHCSAYFAFRSDYDKNSPSIFIVFSKMFSKQWVRFDGCSTVHKENYDRWLVKFLPPFNQMTVVTSARTKDSRTTHTANSENIEA